MSFTDQSPFAVRFEWGLQGLRATAGEAAAIVVVDVLCFTTCVSIACVRGATVFPHEWDAATARDLAVREGARVAVKRGQEEETGEQYTLSPMSLLAAHHGLRLVLPSPNGSALACAALREGGPGRPVVAGAIRNAAAVAGWLSRRGTPVSVIAAGEKWEDETGRFAVEDLIGAGAILAQLGGDRSPEASMAVAAFEAARGKLPSVLQGCSSGRELIERGYPGDVALAAELNADETVPLLAGGAFRPL